MFENAFPLIILTLIAIAVVVFIFRDRGGPPKGGGSKPNPPSEHAGIKS